MATQLFRNNDGLVPNLLLLDHVVSGYILGLSALIARIRPAIALGVLILANALVIAANLIHECAHSTLFNGPGHNAHFGGTLIQSRNGERTFALLLASG